MKTVIHWFRRDFRLTDNPALSAAAQSGAQVIPVYILSDWKRHHHWTGPNRLQFICECLRSLADDLQGIGGRLIIRSARADEELEKLLVETKAEAIYYNRDPDPFGIGMEKKVDAMAARLGAKTFPHKDVALHERDELFSGTGKPYRVYAPYARAWLKLPKPPLAPRPTQLSTPAKVKSLPLPDLSHWDVPPPTAQLIASGEAAARKRLDVFLDTLAGRYATSRNQAGDDTSSRLSQDFRWGLISIREVFTRARELGAASKKDAERESLDKFVSELGWRDFSYQLLFHFPEVLDTEFNPAMRGLPWVKAEGERFERWGAGQTGFPIVDAGMRQLAATGFMHNRLRIIVAMFLTKDLRMHWREGEAFFNRGLVDGEIAFNNTGWQWCAGTGADAAPYFRIQNPWTQSERHDSTGEFIKRYIPELRDVPSDKLHLPPAPGMRLAKGYPAPMVDHGEERQRTLTMFKTHLAKARAEKSVAAHREET